VTKARQVDELVAEVAGASREQTQGITQINTAVGQMDKVTQSNAANAEESAAAAEELNAQAVGGNTMKPNPWRKTAATRRRQPLNGKR
jgi:methyl-accepting chemotaxis protein